jgi:hypothetical protein
LLPIDCDASVQAFFRWRHAVGFNFQLALADAGIFPVN